MYGRWNALNGTSSRSGGKQMCGETAGALIKILQSREMEAAGLPLGMFKTCLRFAGFHSKYFLSVFQCLFCFVVFVLSFHSPWQFSVASECCTAMLTSGWLLYLGSWFLLHPLELIRQCSWGKAGAGICSQTSIIDISHRWHRKQARTECAGATALHEEMLHLVTCWSSVGSEATNRWATHCCWQEQHLPIVSAWDDQHLTAEIDLRLKAPIVKRWVNEKGNTALCSQPAPCNFNTLLKSTWNQMSFTPFLLVLVGWLVPGTVMQQADAEALLFSLHGS